MGFDLWEEIQGQHFFTAMAQLRALREGADFARAFADTGAADWYAQQATQLQALIQRFWNAGKGHLVETLDGSRSGLDCALLLGSLHGSPSVYAKQQTPVFPPYSDEVLVSLLRFTQDQWTRFPINKAEAPSDQSKLAGVGLGRYPEDVYNGYENDPAGGHPWFLCTSSAAEVLYRTASHMSSTSLLTISTLNLPFYTALLPSSSPKPEAGRKYGPNDAVYQAALARLKSLGDEFLDVVRRHASAQGSMSEQFDRVTGFERGANDLTWSYGAFLQAARARDAVM
jgi:glucoamylase